MAVQYVQNNNGGGLFSRLLPQVLNMAGTAVGGPMGGRIGSLIGGAVTGNPSAIATQLIGSINPSAGNPAPATTHFPAFQSDDWSNPNTFANWQNARR